jgi:putative SOS response-associated peptidase YedK
VPRLLNHLDFDAIREWVGEVVRAENIGNLPPQTGVYPDLMAPIVRNQPDFREFVKVRWGMPTSSQALYQAAQKRAQSLIDKGRPLDHDEFLELVRVEPDRGTHNVRNTNSPHWQRWLAPEFPLRRALHELCRVRQRHRAGWEEKGQYLVCLRPYATARLFAGIVAPQWTSVRKVGEGMITTDLFAFLATDANGDVAPVNPDSMPVILTTPTRSKFG